MPRDRTPTEAKRRRLTEQAQDFESKAGEAKTPEVRIGYLELAQRWKEVAERDGDPEEPAKPSTA